MSTANADLAILAKPWYWQWLPRVRRDFWLKTVGITAFITLFFVAYFWLLRNPIFPVAAMPVTIIDDWVPLQPASLWLYLTLWFYVTLPPSLLLDRRVLYRYGVAAALLCLYGLTCFLLWPTAIPAGLVDWQNNPGMDLLKGLDAAGNACPSLHVATAVFSGIWLDRILLEMNAGKALRRLNWLWCVGISYSTLATKQHVFIDLLSGAVLGVVGALLSMIWISRALPARSR